MAAAPGSSLAGKDFVAAKEEVLSWIVQLNGPQRKSFMFDLVEQSDRCTRSILHAHLNPLTRVDFVSALPDKLAKHVLSFCDAKRLCTAAQVSRKWQNMADDDYLWHRMCAQHINRKCHKCGWGLPLVLSEVNDDGQRAKRLKRRWKDIYAERLIIERNWRKGSYNVRKLTGHAEGVTCVQFDDHRIVSGSYDQSLRIWDMRSGECIKVLEGHESSVRCLLR
eukprot:Opistho-2@44655